MLLAKDTSDGQAVSDNMAVKRKRGRRTGIQSGLTREAILVAATRLFCDNGYADVSIRKISEYVGVSHASVIHHFGSKERLWQAVGDYLSDYLQEEIRALRKHIGSESEPMHTMYQLSSLILAHALMYPFVIRYLSEAIRIGKNQSSLTSDGWHNLDEVIASDCCQDEAGRFCCEEKLADILAQLKMLLASCCHSGVVLVPQLDPFLTSDIRKGQSSALYYWRLCNSTLANLCCIDAGKTIEPISLKELIVPLEHPLRGVVSVA